MSTRQVVEIACDESGSEGQNLIGGETDVFAHAGVGLTTGSAAGCVQEIRDRIRSPALEYKANHLLRGKSRSVLIWLLGPSGPIHGHAHVQLTDKTFFVTGKIVDLLVDKIPYVASISRIRDPAAVARTITLYRDGPRTFGREQWTAFLESFIDLMRTTNRRGSKTPVDSFFHLTDLMHRGTPGPVREIMRLISRARPQVDALRARLLDNPGMIPALDPLMPAIIQTVSYWSEEGNPVSVIHDEQSSLTKERITQLEDLISRSSGRLSSLRFVDSRSDPRVQIADFLAGVARRIASEELNDRGDAELTALLRPYVDATSVWGDDRSWSLLGPSVRTS